MAWFRLCRFAGLTANVPWRYEQSSGWLIADGGKPLAQGYAGAGPGKNNPSADHIKDVGPLPRGTYIAEAPVDTMTHGPYVLRLTPYATNEMHGRAGFLMHGDSITAPGSASLGCIIQPRFARERFWESGDHVIEVV